VIRADLRSVTKQTTEAGNIRFTAERTPDGHADRFWALALAVHAASAADSSQWRPVSSASPEQDELANRLLNAIAFTMLRHGEATVGDFNDHHGPAGAELLRLLVPELVMLDGQGRLRPTSAGMMALSASYDNETPTDWIPVR
jgi:hypothetical protein